MEYWARNRHSAAQEIPLAAVLADSRFQTENLMRHYAQIRRTLPPRGHRNASSGGSLAASRNRIPPGTRLLRFAGPSARRSDNVASSLNETNQNQNRHACSTLKSSRTKTRHWKWEIKTGRIHDMEIW